MSIISENTKIKMSFFVLIMGAISSAFTWVGVIQADVSKLKEDRIDLSHKLDIIKETTDYIRGKLDAELPAQNRRGK